MRKLLFGAAALPFLAGIASGADQLSDAQMDRITAGNLPVIMINCPICINSSSTTTSITANGVTVMTSTSGMTGDSGGSTGGSGGSTGGSGGSTGGSGGTSGTPVVTTVTLPPNLVSVLTATTGFSPVLH